MVPVVIRTWLKINTGRYEMLAREKDIAAFA